MSTSNLFFSVSEKLVMYFNYTDEQKDVLKKARETEKLCKAQLEDIQLKMKVNT